jgi:hypothetical protein
MEVAPTRELFIACALSESALYERLAAPRCSGACIL